MRHLANRNREKKKLKKPKSPFRKGFSKIHREDGIWQWRCQGAGIVIIDPNKKFISVHAAYVCGINSIFPINTYFYEKDHSRGSEWTQIKPSMVRDWIDKYVKVNSQFKVS